MTVGTQKIKYKCTENDNHMYLILEDGKFDEIQVGDALEREWIIIGKIDLFNALHSIGVSLK